MALIEVCKGIFRDTDDLEQAEYHYFRRAEELGRRDIAMYILEGQIDAFDIEHDAEYAWLAD